MVSNPWSERLRGEEGNKFQSWCSLLSKPGLVYGIPGWSGREEQYPIVHGYTKYT